MEKHKIRIEKSARYFTLGKTSPQVKTILFVCHGYATLADKFLAEFEEILKDDIFIVAPEGLHRFYTRGTADKVVASWMTKEEREDDIQDYVLFLDQVYREVLQKFKGEIRIVVLGFSQGAATASRWVASGRSHVDDLILWCGFFPPDLTVEGISENVSVKVATASDDKFIGPEEEIKQMEVMKKLAPDLIHVRFEGPHTVDIPTLKNLLNKKE